MLRKTIHLPSPAWAELEQHAADYEMSVAEYVRLIIHDWLTRKRKLLKESK